MTGLSQRHNSLRKVISKRISKHVLLNFAATGPCFAGSVSQIWALFYWLFAQPMSVYAIWLAPLGPFCRAWTIRTLAVFLWPSPNSMCTLWTLLLNLSIPDMLSSTIINSHQEPVSGQACNPLNSHWFFLSFLRWRSFTVLGTKVAPFPKLSWIFLICA